MPVEHYRENGNLSQGYFCSNCGQPCSMYGHVRNAEWTCESNPKLVEKLMEINKNGPKDYVFEQLKK